MTHRAAKLLTTLVLALLALPACASAGSHGDFNGDGRDDAIVGSPGDDQGAVNGAGLVNVIYGSTPNGLNPNHNKVFQAGKGGIKGSPAPNAGYGSVIAVGDFDHDGYDDAAIGIPRAKVGGKDSAGAVNVIYGGPDGLTAGGNQLWTQAKAAVKGDAKAGDLFGTAVATGDFDHDGRDDLAIGTPGDKVGVATGAGAVNVVYGSGAGLTAGGNQRFSQRDGAGAVSAFDDNFGAAVAAGDFDNDGKDDLAIGAPLDGHSMANDPGSVTVFYGTGHGLATAGSQYWRQQSDGIQGLAENPDHFGAALAADDFDADGRDDLAVGVPGEEVNGDATAGAVNVIYGVGPAGLGSSGNQIFTEDTTNIPDETDPGDAFGAALASGHIDTGNGRDLVVGAPGEDVGGHDAAGSIFVIHGNPTNALDKNDAEQWDQDSTGIDDAAEAGDSFGASLAVADLDKQNQDDVIVGIPGETSTALGQGAIEVIYSDAADINSAGDMFIHQGTPGIKNSPVAFDHYGAAVG